MNIVAPAATGITSSDMSARIGLIQNIIARTPMMVAMDVMICVRLCCSVPAMLSMSFVTRLRVSPR
jgi:hypothetical protein